ncbi:hypothetical protein RVS70_09450 [Virgibacillus sp. M23]|uniref:hypothetical protein n=1 Tax=Virgibacillus sp. M23 TaxID=3079030 RepID=UPI002A914669|nr:hypothetical protein [Virgibacillus sp. M23]MDY7044429.1 hypothetical protein [Virgibacillus sp. M23]
MITLLQELNRQFTQVHKESYHNYNTANEIDYPYLTYDFDVEDLAPNVEGFYIDIDIFDNTGEFINVFEIEDKLKDWFKQKVVLTEDHLLRFNFLRSMKVPTGDNLLRRRNMQFYCKVDWRNKEWQD